MYVYTEQAYENRFAPLSGNVFIFQAPSSSLLSGSISLSYRQPLAGHFSSSNPVHHILVLESVK